LSNVAVIVVVVIVVIIIIIIIIIITIYQSVSWGSIRPVLTQFFQLCLEMSSSLP
jgi:hypothetical protein